MVGEGGTPLSKLQAAVREFQVRDDRRVDPKGLRAVIDALEGEFATEVRDAQKSGDHQVNGNITAASWISRTCGMSVTSAADRLCVGEQLQSLPKIAAALSSGEVGYQSVSVLCHLRDQLGDKRDLFNEEEMLGFARQFSVFNLRMICRVARHVADPDGFFNEAEHDYSRRRLHISLMSDGMHAIDGVLDAECGAAGGTGVASARGGRAVGVRDRGCRFPGCDRRGNWSSPHPIVAWKRGGPTHLANELLLCSYHHRLVHEGGWQVIKAGREFRFLPPDRLVMRRARGPGVRWGA